MSIVYLQHCSMRSFKKTTRHVYAFSIFLRKMSVLHFISKISISLGGFVY